MDKTHLKYSGGHWVSSCGTQVVLIRRMHIHRFKLKMFWCSLPCQVLWRICVLFNAFKIFKMFFFSVNNLHLTVVSLSVHVRRIVTWLFPFYLRLVLTADESPLNLTYMTERNFCFKVVSIQQLFFLQYNVYILTIFLHIMYSMMGSKHCCQLTNVDGKYLLQVHLRF